MTSPSDEVTIPSDEVMNPSDEVTNPSDKVTGPSDEVMNPSNEVTSPSDDGFITSSLGPVTLSFGFVTSSLGFITSSLGIVIVWGRTSRDFQQGFSQDLLNKGFPSQAPAEPRPPRVVAGCLRRNRCRTFFILGDTWGGGQVEITSRREWKTGFCN